MKTATIRSSHSDFPCAGCHARPGARTLTILLGLLLATTVSAMAAGHDNGTDDAFLPSPARGVSTVPSNGDANPYGVAFVEHDFAAGSGPLKAGDILVSNFNNAAGQQGTGTTIVDVPKAGGAATLFFQGTAPLGLTTALGLLHKGFVVVGNGPTVDGTAATASPGSLLVIDNKGNLIQTIVDANIQYPWDMALVDLGDHAIAFVSNALSGAVIRLEFKVAGSGLTLQKSTVIGSGYMHRADPTALFVAPTGLVYDKHRNILYVASTEDNEVFAIRDAATRKTDGGTGHVIYQDNVHLHGPLGMAMAPNGHLLAANSDVINGDVNQPSEIVEFTVGGKFVKQLSVDPAQGGSFGLAVDVNGDVATFAAVDDNTASLTIWQLNLP